LTWIFTIAMLTHQGKRELPQGISRRNITSIFDTSHDTAASMVKAIAKVNIADFTPGSMSSRHRLAALEMGEGERLTGCIQ